MGIDNYSINALTGCWEYLGCRTKEGYGKFRRGGRWVYVHREAWAVERGPIPDGLKVLHGCDNPPCRNVEHLFLGTDLDNARDKVAKGRQSRKGGGVQKLCRGQVDEIRADQRLHRVIAAQYGISRVLVTNIKNGKRWK